VAAQQANAPTVTEMWAQSSQEVLNHGTVRVCHRCALPVSTQARFCRRCGTEQG
jgi:ribosomal protein L40E